MTVTWKCRLMHGAAQSLLQVFALAVAMLAWRDSPGWSAGQVTLYFATLTIFAPACGRLLAHKLLHEEGAVAVWRAWPVSVVALFVLVFGHGFEDAGLHPAAPLLVLGTLAFVAGMGASSPPGRPMPEPVL